MATKRKTKPADPLTMAAAGNVPNTVAMTMSSPQTAALFDQATAAAEQAAAANGHDPEVIEAGRYKVFHAPDGSWIIARAVNTCDRCRECGCGDQAEPVQIPAMVIQLARAQGAGLLGKLKAIRKAGSDG